jgi:hypothetical protein
MNAKVSILLTAICLTGCSAQPQLPNSAPLRASEGKPLNYSVPVPQDELQKPGPKACLLGTSCLTMDPRPFEACLVSAKSCGDKGAELLRVVK